MAGEIIQVTKQEIQQLINDFSQGYFVKKQEESMALAEDDAIHSKTSIFYQQTIKLRLDIGNLLWAFESRRNYPHIEEYYQKLQKIDGKIQGRLLVLKKITNLRQVKMGLLKTWNDASVELANLKSQIKKDFALEMSAWARWMKVKDFFYDLFHFYLPLHFLQAAALAVSLALTMVVAIYFLPSTDYEFVLEIIFCALAFLTLILVTKNTPKIFKNYGWNFYDYAFNTSLVIALFIIIFFVSSNQTGGYR